MRFRSIAFGLIASFDAGARKLAASVPALAVLAIVIAATWSLLLGQDANWDLKSYHLYNPFAIADARLTWDIAPAGYQTFFNPALDFPFYVLASSRLPAAITSVLMAAPSALTFLFTARIAWQFATSLGSRLPGVLWVIASVIGITGAAGVPLVGSSMTDPHVSALVLASVDAALVSQTKTNRASLWSMLAAGFLAGSAAGLKLTAAPYAVGLFIAMTVVQGSPRQSIKTAARFALASLGGFLLFAGPWMVTLYRLYGNPIFPLYNELFHSPFWEQVELADPRFRSASAIDLIVVPFRLLHATSGVFSEPTIRDGRLAVGGVSALCIALLGFGRRAATFPILARMRADPEIRKLLLLITFWLIGYFLWVRVFTYYRYALPLEMCSGALVIAFITRALGTDTSRVAVGLLAAICLLLTTVYPHWGRVSFSNMTIEAELPPLAENSLVLLTDRQPVGYLIPYFPGSAKFIAPWWCIDDSRLPDFTNPHYSNLLQARINSTIASFRGALYSIGLNRPATTEAADHSPGSSAAILAAYGLVKDYHSCRPIKTNLDGEHLALCRLHRLPLAQHSAPRH